MSSTGIELVNLREPRAADAWLVVNDGVMGGISESDFQIDQARGVFTGHVSADNNGGFASVRTAIRRVETSGINFIVIKVRGDGKRYQLRVRTSDRPDVPAYKYSFETRAGEWQVVRMALVDFQASFRGRPVPDAGPLHAQSMRSIGFLIADRQFGRFRLEVESVVGVADV